MNEAAKPERDRYAFPQQRNGAKPEFVAGPLPAHARPDEAEPAQGVVLEFGADIEHPLSVERLASIVNRICNDHGVAAGHLSYTIVGDQEMHALNREALQHDYTTDVISFDYGEGVDHTEWLDGEVIVNVDYAQREAEQQAHSTEAELLLYCIHGTLHILGYDDVEPDDAAEMAEKQERYLRLAQAGM